jgi:predicted lipoprotein with Yx(FWY)xxD motif
MTLITKHSMKVVLAISAAALTLAACGGDDGDDSSEASASAPAAGSEVVSIQNVDGMDVLADSEGRTLYTADVEREGILCTEACTSFWDPALASNDEARSASAALGIDLDVIARPDGEQQLSLEGLPLYTFTEEDPGQLEGDGFVDDFEGAHFEWEVAAAPGGAGSSSSEPSSESSGVSPY